MKKLIISAAILSLVGCATPQQNAALAGLVVGAAVMGAAQSNPNHYHPTHQQYHHHHYHNYQYVRPRCTYARGAFIGRNVHGAAIFEYHQICN
jgi:hypothetical protein